MEIGRSLRTIKPNPTPKERAMLEAKQAASGPPTPEQSEAPVRVPRSIARVGNWALARACEQVGKDRSSRLQRKLVPAIPPGRGRLTIIDSREIARASRQATDPYKTAIKPMVTALTGMAANNPRFARPLFYANDISRVAIHTDDVMPVVMLEPGPLVDDNRAIKLEDTLPLYSENRDILRKWLLERAAIQHEVDLRDNIGYLRSERQACEDALGPSSTSPFAITGEDYDFSELDTVRSRIGIVIGTLPHLASLRGATQDELLGDIQQHTQAIIDGRLEANRIPHFGLDPAQAFRFNASGAPLAIGGEGSI